LNSCKYNTILDKSVFAKLANNKNVTINDILNLIFSEITVIQDDLIKEKILELKQNIRLETSNYLNLSQKQLEVVLFKDVTKELKNIIFYIIKQYIDNILDAKNEDLINTVQMSVLLKVVSNFKEAIELELS
jgi:hypothetical protein